MVEANDIGHRIRAVVCDLPTRQPNAILPCFWGTRGKPTTLAKSPSLDFL